MLQEYMAICRLWWSLDNVNKLEFFWKVEHFFCDGSVDVFSLS